MEGRIVEEGGSKALVVKMKPQVYDDRLGSGTVSQSA